MSLIKPVKPVVQQPRKRGVNTTESEQRQNLTRKEIGIVVTSGIGGLVVLFLIAWLLLPLSSNILPFVVAGALPLFTLLAIIYQAVVYRRQWNVMERGLERTDKMIDKMQLQLEAIDKQGEHVAAQAEAANRQAEIMQRQFGAMDAQANTMYEALKTEKRAYLGTNRMNIDLIEKKRLAIYLTNTGKLPAHNVKAKIQVTISTPVDWHETQPENVRIFALGEEDYDFTLTAIYPDSIPVRIGFPLGRHFSNEELTLVVQKKSRLTVNLSIEYRDGFDDGFSYFVLTYRGKDTHGNDSWGIFPTESEKQYDQANPDHPEWKTLY